MTFGSLFAGIGGLDLGLERAGMTCKWQVEIDDYARRVLAKHWPDVPKHDDIRTFYPTSDADVDLICGGFPCTQTSVAAAIHGKRTGLNGSDSGLWYEMRRVIAAMRSQWVVVENTPGAATWQSEVRAGLADLGYVVPDSPVRVAAWDVGATHLRWRLFWVADRNGKGLEVAREIRSSAKASDARLAAARSAWPPIPRSLRMDDGFSNRLHRRDRIRCLGNAVVPQVAEYLGREIMRHAGFKPVADRPADMEAPQ